MNRKLLPLLGVAFVVALIATGIFYGLIAGKLSRVSSGRTSPLVVAARSLQPGTVVTEEDLKVASWSGAAPKGSFTDAEPVVGMTVVQEIGQDEPVTGARLASASGAGGVSLGIPSGQRAVSIQVPDSPGVLRLLRPGHRVDVEVIRGRNGEFQLRTVLQNVEVLAVPESPSHGNSGAAVLTVLANPSDSELLSLADAGGRLRVVLRNPLDNDKAPLAGGELAGLFGARPAARIANTAAARSPRPSAASAPPSARTASHRELELSVRIASASAAGLEQLSARLAALPRPGQLQVSPFRPGWNVETGLQELVSADALQVLSASSLLAGDNRPVAVETSARASASCGVQVHFQPSLLPDGRFRLRFEPQITAP